MYLDASDMHYRLNGMAMDGGMYAGMALILIGLALSAYGVIPRRSAADGAVSRLRVKALDDAPIRPAHVALLAVMAGGGPDRALEAGPPRLLVPGVPQE